jgi:hypothetical protein
VVGAAIPKAAIPGRFNTKVDMRHYDFDFAEALGDTIMEKYEALYLLLVKHNQRSPIRTIIGSPHIMSIFETTRGGFEPTPIIAWVGDMAYVGKMSGTLKFQCFKTQRSAPNELVLLCDDENAVIDFTNF